MVFKKTFKKLMWIFFLVYLLVFFFIISCDVFSDSVKDTQVPTVPSNVVVTSAKYLNYVLIKWNPATDNVKVAGYKIYRNGVEIADTNKTWYIDSSVLKYTSYEYEVAAYDYSQNYSAKSQPIQTKVVDSTPPTVPQNIAASEIHENSIKLIWDESTDEYGIKEYIIYRNGKEVGRVNTNNYVDSSLSPKRVYCYYINAVDKNGNISRRSKTIWVKTVETSSNGNQNTNSDENQNTDTTGTNDAGSDEDNDAEVTNPSNNNLESEIIIPNLTISKQNSSIVLEWQNISAAVNYKVYKAIGQDSDFVKIADVSQNMYTDKELTNGTDYFYKIGYDINNTEVLSNVQSIHFISQTIVSGSITTDTIWDNLGSPYIINGTLTISSKAALTIKPGTVIEGNYLSTSEANIVINGKLIALGTNDNPIVFTSTYDSEYGGTGVKNEDYCWQGIRISNTGEFTADNVKINYAGYTFSNAWGDRKTINSIYNQGKLNISNSSIYNPFGYLMIYIDTIYDSAIRNCTLENYVEVIKVNNKGAGTITLDNNSITRDSSGGDCVDISNTNNGSIIFTNNKVLKIYEGLRVSNRGTGSIIIENNVIDGSAKKSRLSGVTLYGYSTDNISIKNNSIISTGMPLYIDLSGIVTSISPFLERMSENVITDCEKSVGVKGNLSIDFTLPKSNWNYFNSYEILSSNIVIAINKTMTLEPGVVIRGCYCDNSDGSIVINGKLQAIGTKSEPIIFTTIKDVEFGGAGTSSSSDCWQGISIGSTGELEGDYLDIRYGGYCYSNAWGDRRLLYSINVGGKLKLTNSDICNSSNTAVYFNSTFLPIIKNNCFADNLNYSVQNLKDSTITIDCSYNYWGSVYAPQKNGKNKISEGIIYTPWNGEEIQNAIHFGEEENYNLSGNYSKSFSDLIAQSPGFDIYIGRTYNSGDERPGRLFGRGWTFSYEGSIKAYENSPTLKVVRLPNGSAATFVENADGTFTASDSRSTLVKSSDGKYILTTKDQISYSFDNNGYLISINDRNNNTIIINVNADGKPLSIIDSVQRQYTIEYNEQGLISSITDIANRKVKYEYKDGLLVRALDPMNHVTSYTYDDFGYLCSIRDNENNLTDEVIYNRNVGSDKNKIYSVTDKYGNVFTYSYDYTNGKCTITDANGRQIIKWYDSFGYVIKTQDPDGSQSSIEYLMTNGINKFGEEKSVVDRNNNTTIFTRDNRGNITKVTNPDNSYKEYTYDSKNNLISEKDEMGKCIFYVYDSQMVNLEKKVQPLNGTDVYTSSSSAGNFAITSYTYFSNGKLQTLTNPEGNITSYIYDGYWYPQKVTDSEGKITQYQYDNIGNLLCEISPNGYKTEYIYDANSNMEKKVLNGGETTRIIYDSENRKIKEISPEIYDVSLDNIQNHSYLGETGYRYEYYPSGNLKILIDPENNVTTYIYDKYGNMVTETRQNDSSYIYEYDLMNRQSKLLFKENNESQPVLLEEDFYVTLSDGKTEKTVRKYLNGNDIAITVFTYDFAGRLVSTKYPDETTDSINYNKNGTIASTTAQNGQKTYNNYDGLNRLTEKWIPIETVGTTTKYTYYKTVYDKCGRVTYEYQSKDTTNARATSGNLVTKQYQYYKNNKLKTVTQNGKKIKEYQYDNDGNLSKEDSYIDNTNKNTVEYVYNYLNKPIEKKTYVGEGDIFGHDFNSTTVLPLSTVYTYDKNGNLKTETTYLTPTLSSEARELTYFYDKMNRVIEVNEAGQDEDENPVTIITKTKYDFEGNPIAKIDAKGNITQYIYDAKGLLIKTIYACGGVTANYYDAAGRKIAQVSPANYDETKSLDQLNRIEYIYDCMDRIKAISNIYYDTTKNAWISTTSKAYKYDADGNVLKELDAIGYEAGNGLNIDDKILNGYGTEYTYNYIGKVITMLDPVTKDNGLSYTIKYSYDGLGRKVTETNANGAIKAFYYDDDSNLLSTAIKKNSGSSEITLESRTYDYLGNVKTLKDGNGRTITYDYNAFNKLKKVTNPQDSSVASNVICYQYDVLGNLVKQWDSFGTVDLFEYDKQGRVLSHTQTLTPALSQNWERESITTSNRYDKNGNQVYQTDGNGTIKQNTYDSLNRLISSSIQVKDTDGNKTTQTTTYQYDKNGNLLAQTDWLGNTNKFIYDDLNRLVLKIDPYEKVVEKFEYNDNNVQILSYDANNHITSYQYDKNNRLLSTTDACGHKVSQSYDNVGNIAAKTDAKGNTTKYNYDEYNRLISVTNSLNETTSYTYDKNSNMLTQTDGKGNITTYEYNVINKPLRKIDHGGKNGSTYDSTKVEVYTYYPNGKLKTKTDRNGKTTTYTYDCHGRMISTLIPDPSPGTDRRAISISYTYDNNSNMLAMTDNTGTTTRTYDELNRVITKNIPNIDKTSYYYDIITDVESGSNAEKTIDPKGNVIIKIYDKINRLKEVRTGTDVTVYNYYDNGTLQSVVYPNGCSEEYTYYDDNLLHTLTNKKADGTIIEKYIYTYDEAHNMTSKVDSKGTTSYTYDALNRLSSVSEPEALTPDPLPHQARETKYSYDAAGNRLTETALIPNPSLGDERRETTYSYNNQNRLLSTTTKQNNVTTETKVYTYDNNGNVLTTTVTAYINGVAGTSIVTTNIYDNLNQLIKTTTSTGTVIENNYNGEGLRVAKAVNGNITRYLYEKDKVILEVDGAGRQVARNVYGTNLVSRTIDSQILYYLYDGNADVTSLLDSIGNVVESYYYDPFGNILEQTGNVNNNITYRGYQYDSETNTYYLVSRMYDPISGRFLQEDTCRGDTNDPLSLNLYTYVHNEPIMYIDPDGHLNVVNGYDYDKARYGSGSTVYKKLVTLTNQYEKAKTDSERNNITTQAYEIRKIADVQIILHNLNYAGRDKKVISVDGAMGANTAAALNYYTLKNKINVFDKESRYIDSAMYSKVMNLNGGVIKDVEDGRVKVEANKITSNLYLGSLSSKYESNGNPGTIANNSGDPGGKSYGAYQLASKRGSVDNYLNWLQNNDSDIYNQLMNAKDQDGNIYGNNFDNTWKSIANTQTQEFQELQYEYIKNNYYDNSADSLLIKYNFDVNKRSLAVQNVLWSTSVQHGSAGAVNIFSKVDLSASDYEIINQVYDERSKVNKYFSSCSKSIQKGVLNRFNHEREDALQMLYNE